MSATTSEIGIAELLRAIDAAEPLLLLDVRNEHDFASWRIEGRRAVETLHVPYFAFLEDAAEILPRLPRDRPIVVVCARGGSSAMVVEVLRDAGVATRNLDGGMAAYGDHLEPVPVTLDASDAGRLAIWQLQRRGRGCLSYVIRAGAVAVVVDPSRHVERYESFVHEIGARIALVLDTHVHADHLSGGVALAARSGAPYFVGASAGSALANRSLPIPDDGRIHLAGIADEVLELRAFPTPGHTPDAFSFLVAARYLLSGDTLFVRGVGRPDLGDHALDWGRALHRTLHERLGGLDDATLVLPAHTLGAAEAGADGVVARRLGELRTLPEFQIASADAFARAIAATVETAPDSYARMLAANVDASPISGDLAAEWECGRNHCAATSA